MTGKFCPLALSLVVFGSGGGKGFLEVFKGHLQGAEGVVAGLAFTDA